MRKKFITITTAILVTAAIVAAVLYRPTVSVRVTYSFPKPDLRLREAILNGTPAEVKLLLKDDPQLVTRFAFDGKHAIHLAAERGRADVLELLIAEGADVNARTDHNSNGKGSDTALILAIFSGSSQAVGVLLGHGADATARDENGETPLEMAARLDQKEMFYMIRKANKK